MIDGSCEFMWGDMNEDGLLNVLDIVTLANIVLSAGEYVEVGDINEDGDVSVSYSAVQGAWPGYGNISSNPN